MEAIGCHTGPSKPQQKNNFLEGAYFKRQNSSLHPHYGFFHNIKLSSSILNLVHVSTRETIKNLRLKKPCNKHHAIQE